MSAEAEVVTQSIVDITLLGCVEGEVESWVDGGVVVSVRMVDGRCNDVVYNREHGYYCFDSACAAQ